jgi:hypothetical protein
MVKAELRNALPASEEALRSMPRFTDLPEAPQLRTPIVSPASMTSPLVV